MGTVALLLFLILAARGQNQGSAPQLPVAPLPPANQQPPPTAAMPPSSAPPAAQTAAKKAQTKATQQPSPWPQAMPAGLPGFPSGWVADNPPPAAVVNRAWQLLSTLWASGKPGAIKTEQTAGRWITYQAQLHAGNKKGVTAYRLRSEGQPIQTPTAAQPYVLTKATPAPVSRQLPSSSAPAPAPAPAPVLQSTSLRQGSGMGALTAQAPQVKQVQQKLGLAADGKFGPATKAAVVAFQKKNGLTPDGVVGPATRQKLGVSA